eukprot:Skav232657  [mRNA]  locus=scaffold698:62079:62777:+ [translate_table: standard]
MYICLHDLVQDTVPRNMRCPREAPAWIKHDKQVLRFYGFFQETVTERPDENARYRHVSIMYHMEDGTMSMHEAKVENSGIAQGPFLKRQKVMREDGLAYLGPDDLKVGTEITIFGRTIHINGCDRFTRWFFEHEPQLGCFAMPWYTLILEVRSHLESL